MYIEPVEPIYAWDVKNLIQSGMPGDLFELTPYSSNKYPLFLANLLSFHYPLNERIFVGAFNDGKLLGFAEWIIKQKNFHLNNIYICPKARGLGVGKTLYMNGLELALKEGADTLSLDVFSWNHHARSWYQKLGFKQTEKHYWLTGPLFPNNHKGTFQIQNYPDAIASIQSYGFGRLNILTPKGNYPILQLNNRYFRVSHESALLDKDCYSALLTIDSTRNVVVISSQPRIPGFSTFIEASESIRMIKNLRIERDESN
jgi:GNAT superfamily N-acetyltransferase